MSITTLEEQVQLAKKIATKAHEGQFRKGSKLPYITHPEAVANSLNQNWLLHIAAAWLHDTVEDCEITADNLRQMGVYEIIVAIVVMLTRKESESYKDYLLRVKQSEVATYIKIADLKHNMSDLKPGLLRDKYELALYIMEHDYVLNS